MRAPAPLFIDLMIGYSVATSGGGGVLISGPDGYKYKVVPPAEGRKESFVSVGIRVSDLAKSKEYWCGLNGMTSFPKPAPAGTECDFPSETVGYAEEQVIIGRDDSWIL